jgi:dihydroxy-acid dehydratase
MAISSEVKRRSRAVTTGLEQTPNRSYLRGFGLTHEDPRKPLLRVASTWNTVTPCNTHILLSEGVAARGWRPEIGEVGVVEVERMGESGGETLWSQAKA